MFSGGRESALGTNGLRMVDGKAITAYNNI